MALGEVALAPAIDGGIHRDEERGAAAINGAGDVVVHPGLVAAHIELKYARGIGRGCGDGFQPRLAHGREHMGGTEFARRPHHRRGGAGMEAFQRADRRQHHGQPQPPPERRHMRIHMGDVAQHPRPEAELIEREPVAPQRGFRLGGADDVVPVVLVEILARLGDDLVQGLEIGSGRRQALRGELFGIAVLHGDALIAPRQRAVSQAASSSMRPT